MMRRLLLSAATALFAGVVAALAAGTTLWSPSIGDVTYYGPLGGTYTKLVPVTGFRATFTANQSQLILNPAGTLALGYVTMAPSPVPDGQPACVFSSQTISTLNMAANVGQTLNNALTSLTANVRACWIYSLSNTTWDRSQ